ncbi:D-alanyl-D-alanine carboxypeptidase family protein [Parvibaculum sp.]|uniref:D-alanyl-D-alanine carboxypeptidase family protein n=1 Tax=Parvibaculum sp. TaxID=2024848 RepID=UPI00273027C3|nr:D-alanyl-D-alanine carboxypeptidase family protein [Parvibaculum sp.]MDP1628038.1 D-alanyl-D-alanine carboxypeptidase family protein [Parvibaculum sp.]MDP2151037.1 D-alanyl-D-alanine carboxypeptidase family protein [Parvibaculum sp.]MDP3328504.1 D-alanyl-D-alanine carboxypeptidase family protein [Parvibaculum sp.]
MTRPISHIAFALAFAVAAFVMPRAALAFDTTAEYAVLMDYETGTILWGKNPDGQMHPASMSKLMTLDMLFGAIRDGSVDLDDDFKISENAWRKGGAASGSSTMFADLNTTVPVHAIIRGIIVQSGNDACIATAEALSGSESAFAEAMTERGKEIGLTNSNFTNSTGWPEEDHLMTPHDLATLARHLIMEFPEYYPIFKETDFTWNGIKQGNRNPALYLDPSVDGLKTGHTEASGYGLVASAKRGDQRLILVLNGLLSQKARADESVRLLDWGFRSFKHYKLFAAGTPIENAPVWQGTYGEVPLVSQSDIDVILSTDQRKNMKVSVVYQSPVAAPVEAGQRVGSIRIEAPDMPVREFPLVAGGAVERQGIFGRAMGALKHMIVGS